MGQSPPKPDVTWRTAETAPFGEQVMDALEELFDLMRERVQTIVRPLDLLPPFALSLLKIEGTTAMKDLGARLHCDPSFVTAIADALEEGGLARREIDRADRRVKNLVLTRRGRDARARLRREFVSDLPGIRRLNEAERRHFLDLIRKMVAAEKEPPANYRGERTT